jgi:hypothetical protein
MRKYQGEYWISESRGVVDVLNVQMQQGFLTFEGQVLHLATYKQKNNIALPIAHSHSH